ncbi:MAG: alpha-galactosidase [Paludibacter sp.]|nr:alpha-galactosidase [Paludibacter sp.]
MRYLFILFYVLIQPFNLIAHSNDVKSFQIKAGELKIDFGIYNQKFLRQLTFLPQSEPSKEIPPIMPVDGGYDVSLYISGEDKSIHFGNPTSQLQYIGIEEKKLAHGKEFTIIQRDTVHNLHIVSYYIFNDSVSVVQRYTKVINNGKTALGIEYLSSAMLYNYNVLPGIVENQLKIHYATNSWMQEVQWKIAKPSELGWNTTDYQFRDAISFCSNGSFSTGKYLPMGMIENTKLGLTWFWQIEHNGSWYWEMSEDANKQGYLYLGGPDELHNHAWKQLKPGESYQSVPVALGVVKGGFNEAVTALTKYRRTSLLRTRTNNQNCPVIFNDYMNCLMADPTTVKEIPLIETASKLNIKYYVIDAGWYAELNQSWWTEVGLWEASKSRFDGGLKKLLEYIKSKGMLPGLWLEIEVVGVNSALKIKPDSWFLMRHGSRVIDNGRYLLDFRNQEVIAWANSVIDRLIADYGVSYFKIDYNSKELIGTETNTSSSGQGLLEHNRAVIQWYKNIQDKYPNLVIEVCASGGNRLDYATLSQAQLVSVSDQQDYRKFPAILVGSLAAVLPEQLGIWSYPSPKANAVEASFNMVSAMFGRMYLSGLISQLPPPSYKAVKEGIDLYQSKFATFIPQSTAFFPLGMPSISDDKMPISVGLINKNKAFLGIWRLEGAKNVTLNFQKGIKSAKLIYPLNFGINFSHTNNALKISFPEKNMACVIELEISNSN